MLLGLAGGAGLIVASPVLSQDAHDGDSATVDTLFADFLHYSVLGRFQMADTYAQQLLDHPDLDPVLLLQLSESHSGSMDTLRILVGHAELSEVAGRVIQKINEGEHLQRQDIERIRANIAKLGGDPQTEHNAIVRLRDSGEYAIPWMLQTLQDPASKALWPRVIRALPQIGKEAVNPLVEAMAVDDENICQTIIFALGELGYPHAVPYLNALAADEGVAPDSRAVAMTVIERIRDRGGMSPLASAAVGFVLLAEQFYDERGSARADDRVPNANVWYWDADKQFLEAVAVPREIYGSVMAMRCCVRSLGIDSSMGDAVALWLAANIRREARLGLDVESGDTTERGMLTDPTKSADFPRAIYFTSAAGARYAHMALGRATGDGDAAVTLGAIAGLRRVGGASSLIGAEGFKQPLVRALRFSDLVVRIRAALALGESLPRSGFSGSELVIPVLSNALLQTGRRNILVVDADERERNLTVDALRGANTNVIGEANMLAGIERAGKEFPWLTAIFMSADLMEPGAAIASVRERYELAGTPIILVVQPAGRVIVETLVGGDVAVGSVDRGAQRDELMVELDRVEARIGRTPLSPDRASALAMEAAGVLNLIATDGRSVFNPDDAATALITVLDGADETLRIASMKPLSLLTSATAQIALARTAVDGNESESVRLPAFARLAVSAKRYGNQLDRPLVTALLSATLDEPNLQLRTAASIAVGALDLSPEKAHQVLLKYEQG